MTLTTTDNVHRFIELQTAVNQHRITYHRMKGELELLGSQLTNTEVALVYSHYDSSNGRYEGME